LRYALISCDVLLREICMCIYRSPHAIDVRFLPRGLHDQPDRMRSRLQGEIDSCRDPDYDAVLLGFGLCGNVLQGIKSRHHRLVVPRAHDCITLFLGSKERYMEQFSRTPGTYYYTSGSFERKGIANESEVSSIGSTPEPAEKRKKFEIYKERFGEENARYLVQVEDSWERNYQRAVYIDFPALRFLDHERRVKELAQAGNLDFEVLPGNLSLLEDLVNGNWPDDRFLTVQPGDTIVADYTHDILKTAR